MQQREIGGEPESSREDYTIHVGRKFHGDGRLRYFPGATVISFIDENHPLYRPMCRFQQRCRDRDQAGKYSFLPPSSFHMTVFELYTDFDRDEPGWSRNISEYEPADAVNRELFHRFKETAFLEEIRMKPDFLTAAGLKLKPADEEAGKSIRSYRDALSEKTGIRFPGHRAYRFHTTSAYRMRSLTEEEQEAETAFLREAEEELKNTVSVFSLPEPCFCTFADMGKFTPYEESSKTQD